VARYDEIFQTLVERAISQGGIDVETFMRRAIQSGMSEDVLMSLLEEDLLNDGPIFGKYVRSMVGAARSSVMAAERQGETISYLVSDPEVRELLRDLDIEEVEFNCHVFLPWCVALSPTVKQSTLTARENQQVPLIIL